MGTKGYEDLKVWQKAMDVTVLIYKLTDTFPQQESYSLVAQMRKAAVSIPSNIAEGSKRQTSKDFAYFVSMAFGSGAELETQLKIAKRLEFGTMSDYKEVESMLEEVMKMLNTLLSKLQTSS